MNFLRDCVAVVVTDTELIVASILSYATIKENTELVLLLIGILLLPLIWILLVALISIFVNIATLDPSRRTIIGGVAAFSASALSFVLVEALGRLIKDGKSQRVTIIAAPESPPLINRPACLSNDPGAQAQGIRNWTILSGPSNQTYFHFAGKLRDRASQHNWSIQVEPTSGSEANLKRLLAEPNTQMALVQSDVLFTRYGRQLNDKTLLIQHVLFYEQVHLVTLRNSGVKTINDLSPKALKRKRIVAIGENDSGSSFTAREILNHLNLDVVPTQDAPMVAREKLIAGKLDAFFFVTGKAPELLRHPKLAFVRIDVENSDFSKRGYFSAELDANDYPLSITTSIATIATTALLICHKHTNCQLVSAVNRVIEDRPILYEPELEKQLNKAYERPLYG